MSDQEAKLALRDKAIASSTLLSAIIYRHAVLHDGDTNKTLFWLHDLLDGHAVVSGKAEITLVDHP